MVIGLGLALATSARARIEVIFESAGTVKIACARSMPPTGLKSLNGSYGSDRPKAVGMVMPEELPTSKV
ncbi:hypothetical protein D9M71_680030 [compost metagenome]